MIDALPSFGFKAILGRDIVSHDCWFESSNDICKYLSSRCDSRRGCTNLDPKSTDEKQQNKEDHKIKGVCPNIFLNMTVYNSEYLCECEECINLNVSSCVKEAVELEEIVEQVNVESNTEIEKKNDYELDEDTDQTNHI